MPSREKTAILNEWDSDGGVWGACSSSSLRRFALLNKAQTRMANPWAPPTNMEHFNETDMAARRKVQLMLGKRFWAQSLITPGELAGNA
jgi:hypothetical protein